MMGLAVEYDQPLRRLAKRCQSLLLPALASLALAGCSGLVNLAAPDSDAPIPPSQ